MCGRNSLFLPRPELESRFDAEVVADGGYEPRYNIAPGEGLAVIAADAPGEIDRYRWGLGADGRLINARAETAAERPAFADAWAARPCLVLSTGFYEWDDARGTGRPYRVHRAGDRAFAMAGLWDRRPDGARSVTVLTTRAGDPVRSIHDRMPVVLPESAEREWLTAGPDARAALCRPYPGDDLRATEVSTRVNDPATDDPSVIDPVAGEQAALEEFGVE